MEKLKDLIKGQDLIVAPVALNPIMAQMAALAGFKAAYLSGGSLGWYKGVTEAGLSLSEMIQVVVDMGRCSRGDVVGRRLPQVPLITIVWQNRGRGAAFSLETSFDAARSP